MTHSLHLSFITPLERSLCVFSEYFCAFILKIQNTWKTEGMVGNGKRALS